MGNSYLNKVRNNARIKNTSNSILTDDKVLQARSFEAYSVTRVRNGTGDAGCLQFMGLIDDNFYRMGTNSSSPNVGA